MVLYYVMLLFFLLSAVSGIAVIVSLISVDRTFKWAKVKDKRKKHAFCFYILLTAFLFFNAGFILEPTAAEFVVWLAYFAGLLYYFYKLRNPKIPSQQTEEDSSK